MRLASDLSVFLWTRTLFSTIISQLLLKGGGGGFGGVRREASTGEIFMVSM